MRRAVGRCAAHPSLAKDMRDEDQPRGRNFGEGRGGLPGHRERHDEVVGGDPIEFVERGQLDRLCHEAVCRTDDDLKPGDLLASGPDRGHGGGRVGRCLHGQHTGAGLGQRPGNRAASGPVCADNQSVPAREVVVLNADGHGPPLVPEFVVWYEAGRPDATG